jgi:hypothetical protein
MLPRRRCTPAATARRWPPSASEEPCPCGEPNWPAGSFIRHAARCTSPQFPSPRATTVPAAGRRSFQSSRWAAAARHPTRPPDGMPIAGPAAPTPEAAGLVDLLGLHLCCAAVAGLRDGTGRLRILEGPGMTPVSTPKIKAKIFAWGLGRGLHPNKFGTLQLPPAARPQPGLVFPVRAAGHLRRHFWLQLGSRHRDQQLPFSRYLPPYGALPVQTLPRDSRSWGPMGGSAY